MGRRNRMILIVPGTRISFHRGRRYRQRRLMFNINGHIGSLPIGRRRYAITRS